MYNVEAFMVNVLASLQTIVSLSLLVTLQQETISSPITITQDPMVIGAAVVLVLSSLGGTTVLIINALSASKDRREAAEERRQQLAIAQATAIAVHETGKKADNLIEGTAKIHELTNSTNSKLQSALELMTERHSALERVIAAMEAEKQDTASMRTLTDLQTAAALLQTPPHSITDPGTSQTAEESLKRIDASTDATAKNTARTELAVSKLKDK